MVGKSRSVRSIRFLFDVYSNRLSGTAKVQGGYILHTLRVEVLFSSFTTSRTVNTWSTVYSTSKIRWSSFGSVSSRVESGHQMSTLFLQSGRLRLSQRRGADFVTESLKRVLLSISRPLSLGSNESFYLPLTLLFVKSPRTTKVISTSD